jgi:hypothetical protein
MNDFWVRGVISNTAKGGLRMRFVTKVSVVLVTVHRLEHSLDYKVHRRFGELIASSAGHHAAGYYGWTKDDYVVWPPEPRSRHQ